MERSIIDCHFHLCATRYMSRLRNVDDTLAVLRGCGLRAICVQNIVLWFPEHLTRNPLSLLAKLRAPDRVFAFGGIRYPVPDAPDKHFDYRAQAGELMALGFDGIKLFGKPTIRQAFGMPFDADVFDELFAYLEERQIPVLYHVGDPREFWSAETAPPFARENGWIYDDPPFDQYYDEIDGLLTKFPRLRVLFPHFFFLSDDLPRLARFLEKWPNVWLDITPGTEMYYNFSRNPAAARDFFLRFQDRILWGTDNVGVGGAPIDPVGESAGRLDTMWEFLTGEIASGWGGTLRGLSLPEPVVEKVCRRNFYRFVGRETPAPVDAGAAASYARRMGALAREAGDARLDAAFDELLTAYQSIG